MLNLRSLSLLVALAACSGTTDATDDGRAIDAREDAGETTADVPYLTRLPSLEAFAAVAAGTREVKFLASVKDAEPTPPIVEPCYFQNMALFPWHLDFLHSFPEGAELTHAQYSNWVLRHETRRWWGGSLRRWQDVRHPVTNQPGLVTFELYNEEVAGNPVPIAGIVEVAELLKDCAEFASDRLAFLPLGESQTQVVAFYREALAAKGVTVVLPEEMAAACGIDVVSSGEGYGYLTVVPDGQELEDYGPRDVVIVRSAPEDLSIVAGLITADPQNQFSHVNLRLAEKGIPNASVPEIYAWPNLEAKRSLLVHVVAREGTVGIEAATLEDAQAFWASAQPHPVQVESDLEPVDLRGFDRLRAGDAPAFGTKAANLGELHSILDPHSRVEGFGIPVAHYREFVEERGIQEAIESALASAATFADAKIRRASLKSIRAKIRKAPLLPGFEAALQARLAEVYGSGFETLLVRFRSSSNAEDLADSSEAGLYASRSGCLADDLDGDDDGPSACLGPDERAALERLLAQWTSDRTACPDCPWLEERIAEVEEDLTEEKPIADAVRGVWASLWTDLAFEEREYWRIDHLAVNMGIAVNPTFVLETRDAIVVTGLATNDETTLYQAATVVAPESVAEPEDPRVVPEVMTFRREAGDPTPRDVTIRVPSSQVDEGQPLWTDQETRELASIVFTIHDHFANLPWNGTAPESFDIELKKDSRGRIVVKQVRPYRLAP